MLGVCAWCGARLGPPGVPLCRWDRLLPSEALCYNHKLSQPALAECRLLLLPEEN
jgi:hypothetical protein